MSNISSILLQKKDSPKAIALINQYAKLENLTPAAILRRFLIQELPKAIQAKKDEIASSVG